MNTIGVKTVEGNIVPVKLNKENNQEKETGQEVFTTVGDRQEKALFEIFCRENDLSDWFYIKGLMFEGIPSDKAGNPVLELNVSESSDGNLSLIVVERTLSKQAALQIDRDELADKYKEKQIKDSSPSRPIAERHEVKVEKSPRKRVIRFFVLLIITISILLFLAVTFQFSPLAAVEKQPWVQRQIERVFEIGSRADQGTEIIVDKWLSVKQQTKKIIVDKKPVFETWKDRAKEKIEGVLQGRK